MKRMIQTHAAVRRMAMSVVALHVVARIVDYYITKYAAKPMEQLQNLVTQYALGLKRLEVEEEQEKTAIATAGAVEQRTNEPDDVKAGSLRVLRRLQHSANRSKWISSTECAFFVHTEQQHWTSHNEVPMFLSRPLYQISECKRILSGSKHMLTRAAPSVNFSVLDFAPAADAEPLVKRRRLTRKCPAPPRASACGGPHPATAAPPALDAPRCLHNIGNTCFMNSLLQCCRQLLMRIPVHLLPESQQCPLARALQALEAQLEEKERDYKNHCMNVIRISCKYIQIAFHVNIIISI